MLVNMKEILKEVEEKGCAIGCINALNIETLRAVADATEELDVPIIADHVQVHDPLIPMESTGPEMVGYAKQAKVLVCVHLDYGNDYSFVMRTIRCGFSSIMYGLSALSFEENMAKLKEFVKIVHGLNIIVEAELGIMTSTEEGSHGRSIGRIHESVKKTLIDPQQVAGFVRETGVDTLAVCFGTAHGIYAESPLLDIERAKAIRAAMPKETRVVMHGGSGVDGEQVRAAITAGCPKINYYSYTATAASRYIQEYLNGRDGKVFWHEVEEESYRSMKEYAKGAPTILKNGKQHWG